MKEKLSNILIEFNINSSCDVTTVSEALNFYMCVYMSHVWLIAQNLFPLLILLPSSFVRVLILPLKTFSSSFHTSAFFVTTFLIRV